MRLLVVTPPQFGHVRPALPLARALAAARHRVAWASGADALSRLADEPVEAIVCGPTSAQARERLHACWPDLDRLTPREHGPAMRHRLFGEVVVAAMAPALERCLDDWRPDAVLHDPLALAALLQPSLFTFVTGEAVVDTSDGEQRGQTTLQHAATGCRIAASVNGPRFRSLFLSRVMGD